MNFICDPCKSAENVITTTNKLFVLEAKKGVHSKCLGGTWCDCQHKVGRKNT